MQPGACYWGFIPCDRRLAVTEHLVARLFMKSGSRIERRGVGVGRMTHAFAGHRA